MTDLAFQVICGIPELAGHAGRPITHVLSILDPAEPEPAAFAHFPAHDRLTLRFDDIIAPRGSEIMPTRETVAAVLDFGARIGREGLAGLLIHCHAGISRSTASAVMLLAQADPERDEDDIFAHIAAERPIAWPNSVMIGFADEALGRGGRLTAALRRHYARRLAADDWVAREMRALGRGAEVEMAG